MLTKNDCMSILVNISESNTEANIYLKKLMVAKELPMDVLKFIAKNNGIELNKFYDLLRKNHNNKKSPLYKNILDEKILSNPTETVLTLSCLLTQLILYSKKLDSLSQERFLKEARTAEITKVLAEYFSTFNSENCIKMLKVIKSEILVLEYLVERRNLVTTQK